VRQSFTGPHYLRASVLTVGVWTFANTVVQSSIPLLTEEGWLRHKENAAGGIRNQAQTGWSVWDMEAQLTTPSAPPKDAFGAFFLRAQPPLLFKEGTTNVQTPGRLHS
jgi:hypothetical protein